MTPQEIARLRQDLGWSLTVFAFHFSVSAMTVSNWEHGIRTPDPYKKAAIQQLRYLLDQVQSQQQQEDFLQALAAVAALGIGAFLAYLFGSSGSGGQQSGGGGQQSGCGGQQSQGP